MIAVPADTPVTSPEEGSTVALDEPGVLQEPLAVVSLKVTTDPTQTLPGPVMGAGS